MARSICGEGAALILRQNGGNGMDGFRNWTVTVDGQPHEVGIKFGLFRATVHVDGERRAAKSKNQFVRVIDEDLSVDGKDIRITAMGNSVDVAVDGIYLRSGKPYVPMSLIPIWATVMIPVLMATGLLLFGVLGFALGLLAGVLALHQSLPVAGKSRLPLCSAIYAVTLVIQLVGGIYSHGWL
ncbi:hypothetical protein [Faecalispora jeddahensis]|uniref:hypothetical protein n=1 Tax=Faecalispora jeddahensis TaxID=1414721 RepID=UPI0028A8EFDD|nr:hypothetical protein [Faecalispora jeddahensis]